MVLTHRNFMESKFTQFFEHSKEEPKISSAWLSSNVYSLECNKASEKEPFVLTMPPPNANGELHLGHVFGYVTMDILARFYRAMGHPVLLLPGKDHAGIQTQVVFEKKLQAEGVNLKTLSREELYERCYSFCLDRAQYMRMQEQSIGISADWQKECFTLDPKLNSVIYETFDKMWKDGLVYKGDRIVNWSVFSQTAISDVEVEYQEQKGHLWSIRYAWSSEFNANSHYEVPCSERLYKTTTTASVCTLPNEAKIGSILKFEEESWIIAEIFPSESELNKFLEKHSISPLSNLPEGSLSLLVPWQDISSGLITATTRPETLLGDTALAVHPDDIRYKNCIGKKVKVPRLGYEISVIASSKIDRFFGTGVVKVTPAHDFFDYELGLEAKLELRQVIGKDGKMTELAGEYAGLASGECRKKLLSDLEASGELVSTKEIKHKVPISERGKDIIEPLISEQWWVAVDKPGNSLKEKALKLLRDGKLKIYPENFTNQVITWFENLKDWNISRQLWWGHQLPVWYKGDEIKVGVTSPGEGWERDPDTFDTWFSSGQWPYSTTSAAGLFDINSPQNSKFFPTHTMVMGRDILFFWACRMILFAAYRFDNVPFKNLYFHGLIRDEKGQKMSKSKGNGIEPKEMLEKYGADALRLGMIVGTAPGIDLKLSIKKIEGYGKFTNKLWNAAKLIEMKTGELPVSKSPPTLKLETSRWILQSLKESFEHVTSRLTQFAIPQGADSAYDFTWFTYCDWYLEMMKSLSSYTDPNLQQEVKWVAETSFRKLLLLLHPFIPFVTEAIYERMPSINTTEMLCQMPWEAPDISPSDCSSLKKIMNMISAIRQVKAAVGLPLQKIEVALPKGSSELSQEAKMILQDLARVEVVLPDQIPEIEYLRKPFQGGEIVCRLPQKDAYHEKLKKDLEDAEKRLITIETKLSSDFAERADANLVLEEKKKHSDLKAYIEATRYELGL